MTQSIACLDLRPPSVSDEPSYRSAVTEIWFRTLGPRPGGAETNILRFGVGLKRIVRLLKTIELEVGVKIPATALLRLGTLDALIGAIESRHWPASSPCLLLKDGDDRPPLYVVSAGSGIVLELCDFVREIDYPGQIWGLQLPGLDGECEPLTDLRAMAQCYRDAIVARQGTGPYNLVGYSFGGAVALETARLLDPSGASIGLLGLIDSNTDERYWPKRAWLLGVAKRCLKRAADARNLPPRQAVKHIVQRARNLFSYYNRQSRGETAASIHRSTHYVGGFEPQFQQVRDAAIIAYETYRPAKTNLRVTLFKSDLGDPHACDPYWVWKQYIRNLTVVPVPGSHTTMVRPPLARKLAQEIANRI
jgi:thioesterase domain-containing protein